MSVGAVKGSTMEADTLDFTPRDYEALTPADVKRCFIASDVADRILTDAVNAMWPMTNEAPREACKALAVAHMHAAAIAYAVERLAASSVTPGESKTNDA